MIIGIDPGYSGGICFLNNRGEIEDLHTIPLTADGEVNFTGLIGIMSKVRGSDVVVLEDVHSIFGSSAKSNFQFGRICGILRTVSEFTGAEIIMAPPKTWQKKVWLEEDKVLKGKRTDTKATSLNAAKRIFPDVDFRKSSRAAKPHDGLVDAALIAYSYN